MKINVNKQEKKQYRFKDVNNGDVFKYGNTYWMRASNLISANAIDLADGCCGLLRDDYPITLVRAVLEVTHENS